VPPPVESRARRERGSVLGPPLLGVARVRCGRERGFTLIELLVVILVSAVVAVAVLAAFSSLSGGFHEQGVRMQNQDDARTAINQMTRYIRMATSSADNLTTQSNAIATALPQDIEFYCDVDGDGVAEKVRYYLDGITLLMQTAEPVWITGTSPHWQYPAYETDGVVIQDAVRNGVAAVFSYYRYASGVLQQFTPATAGDRMAIATVSISVTVNEKPELANGNVVLATDVQIRQRYEGGLE
jgi:prepilin-type N-terminal cleavage/methylation domain-containing protein